MQTQHHYSGAIARNTKSEIAQFMRENPGCTIEDALMVGEWSEKELRHHLPAAVREAGRESIRRLA